MAYVEDSVAATVADPQRLARFARWSAEDVLNECYRWKRATRYSDEAIARRAERDVQNDLDADVRLGFTYTPEEAAAYRRMYVEAYLAAWHDEALHERLREEWSHRGFIIICCR